MGAPVKHTCPDIDKLIKKASNSIKWLSDCLKSDDIEFIKNIIYDSICELEDIEGEAEYLRDANSSLRDWGDEMESEKERLVEVLYQLNHKYY